MAGKKALLSQKQRLFISEYLKDCNAGQAALRAGYAHRERGVELMAKPHIRKLIEAALRRIEKKVEMKVENLLAVTWALAISDITNYVAWDKEGKPKVKPSNKLDWADRQSLRTMKFSYGKHGPEVTFSTHDKQHALNLLFKYYKLTGEKQTFQEWLQAVDEPLRLRITQWLEQQAAHEMKSLYKEEDKEVAVHNEVGESST